MRSVRSQRLGQSLLLSIALTAMLAVPAVAQTPGIQWRHDLAAAQAEAQETGKPMLIHFWTPTCGPCRRLEGTVFNQASVAQAVESQFVPVKINAEAAPGVARQYAVFQWPTDVITTPQGHALGKMISPPTPTAYISQVSQVANRFKTRLGAGFDQAVANAERPVQSNSAYAGLAFNAPPVAQTNQFQQMAASNTQPSAAARATPIANQHYSGPPAYQSPAGLAPQILKPATSPTSPAVTANPQPGAQYQPNRYQDRYAPAASNPATTAPPVASTTPPVRFDNPYTAPKPPAAPQTTAGSTQAGIPNMPTATAPNPNPTSEPLAGIPPITPVPAGNASPTPSAKAPLGFDGFCPVSMKKQWRWVKGDARWGIVHRGRTYLFSSEVYRDEFWKNPDLYSPALSGNDAVLAIDRGQATDGTREHSLEYGGHFYMFASEASLQQFSANPSRYVAGVRQAMGLDASEAVAR